MKNGKKLFGFFDSPVFILFDRQGASTVENILGLDETWDPEHDWDDAKNSTAHSQGNPCCKHMYIEVTGQCNLSCPYCIAGGPKNESGLSAEQLTDFLDRFAEQGGSRVTFGGGEPLLRKDLPQLVDHCVLRGLKRAVLTNGILLEQHMAWLVSTNTDIQVSWNPPEDIREHETDPTLVDPRVIGAIQRIFNPETRKNITVAVTLTRQLARHLEKLIDLALSLEISDMVITPVLSLDPKLALTQEEMADAFITLRQLQHDNLEKITLRGPVFTGVDHLFTSAPRFSYHCDMGSTLYVTREGDVMPCPYIRNKSYSLGNILQKSWAEIAAPETLRKIHDTLISRRKRIADCRTCIWQQVCGGGCTAWSVFAKGAEESSDPTCFARQRFYTRVMEDYSNSMDSVKKTQKDAK